MCIAPWGAQIQSKNNNKKDFCCTKLVTEPSYKACQSVTTHSACFQASFHAHSGSPLKTAERIYTPLVLAGFFLLFPLQLEMHY